MIGAGVFPSLGLWTAAADFVLVGIRRKTPLFLRVCARFWGLTAEWLTATAALAILVVGLLVILQLFWVWVGLGLLAIGIAVAFTSRLTGRPRPNEARSAGTGPGRCGSSDCKVATKSAAAVRLHV